MQNLLALADQVEQRYRRYIKTSFYFRDPELRASFEQELASGYLRKGPYLEATPVFKRGRSPAELFPEVMPASPDEGFLAALDGSRPLYTHQEQAIVRAMQGRNVVVATGTGSGKTEAFLYPILLHLYQEYRQGTLCPGIRALILYPMNALAFDQRQRLGEIAQRLQASGSGFRFTFGQYVGATPEDQQDGHRQAAERLPGELVLRSEMRAEPPHILLTNYSMLEYLLLRPDDSRLFDGGNGRWWKFLVVDEAHQYRGSRGTEMAMLLRRVKQRLREGGRKEPFLCIATSASLGAGEGIPAAAARFGSNLFGEPFATEDVLQGEHEALPEGGPYGLLPEDYATLARMLDQSDRIATDAAALDLARRVGISSLPSSARELAGAVLARDRRAAQLRRMITGAPRIVAEVAEDLFGDVPVGDRLAVLNQMVEVMVSATVPGSTAPFLAARYHLFLRSLEGAFVAYWPAKQVFLDRKSGGAGSVAFEVALCRECGQHFFVGRRSYDGRLEEAFRDFGDEDFRVSYFRPIEGEAVELVEDEEDIRPHQADHFWLCTRCGRIDAAPPDCSHEAAVRVVEEPVQQDPERADQLRRCGACGYNASGRDPVREVVYGSDGPNAVIATTLHTALPEERRKILAFADGRQEAAFFAWYLEESYHDIVGRNLLAQAARELAPFAPDGVSLSTLADRVAATLRERQLEGAAADDLTIKRGAWRRIYREFLTDEPRLALEGVGLTRWFPALPAGIRTPTVLLDQPWSLTEQEARIVLAVLLDFARLDRAVELRVPQPVSLGWGDLGFDEQNRQLRIVVGAPGRQKDARSWDGENGRRARYLAKLLKQGQPDLSDKEAAEYAVKALRRIWDDLRDDERATAVRDRLILPASNDAIRLNPDWWRMVYIEPQMTVWQCSVCNRLSAVSVRDVCPRTGCRGKLQPCRRDTLPENHYRLLYEEDLPGAFRVEEHTAQLTPDKAREFQTDFQNNKINVLSSSTTFELGVDLGDLSTVFLRNVPPEAFNYAQRVGRAGRRRGMVGFALTFCRRSPHDLYHFIEPERILSGRTQPPSLSLRNDKILERHMVAVVLSAFFRSHAGRFNDVNTLLETLGVPTLPQVLLQFCNEQGASLSATLRAVIPSEMHQPMGLESHTWPARLAGPDSRLELAVLQASSDFADVQQLEIEAVQKRDYRTANWAKNRRRTLETEDVLSFLSRYAVIPKYGFPVDVVNLDTRAIQQEADRAGVELQRDLALAIAEFAPGSRVIANKKEWVSYGLKRVAGKAWEVWNYKRCLRHNSFRRWSPGGAEPELECGDSASSFRYIVPRFGFVTSRDLPTVPNRRPRRSFSTRPFFISPEGPDPGWVEMPKFEPALSLRRASPGWMAVVCEGRGRSGFYICEECGYGSGKRESKHSTPNGRPCAGSLRSTALGHQFVTDVVQLHFYRPPEPMDPAWFSYSLACALVEGAAEVLDVPAADMNAVTVFTSDAPVFPIVLYDTAPGGAGLVARLEDERVMKACLEVARNRTKGDCGCDPSTSCYGCLRSYRNQFAHHLLQRGPVHAYLSKLLRSWR